MVVPFTMFKMYDLGNSGINIYAPIQAIHNPCFYKLLPMKVHWNGSQTRDFPPREIVLDRCTPVLRSYVT